MIQCWTALWLNPQDRDDNLHTAYWPWERAKAGDEAASEAIGIYERLSRLAPKHRRGPWAVAGARAATVVTLE